MAGKIHTDFERGFIRAETYSYDDMMTYKSENALREAGKIRQEGKTYVDAQFHLCWHAGDRVSIFDSAGSNAEYSFAGEDGTGTMAL